MQLELSQAVSEPAIGIAIYLPVAWRPLPRSDADLLTIELTELAEIVLRIQACHST